MSRMSLQVKLKRREEAKVAFSSEETFKAIAAKLHISVKTLRLWWTDDFGTEAFITRGKIMHVKGAKRRGLKRHADKVIPLNYIVCARCEKPKPSLQFDVKWIGTKLVQVKYCTVCKQEMKKYRKNKKNFSKNKELGLISAKRQRHERSKELQKLKLKPCIDCGKNFPWYVMDFDHRDPSTKKGDIKVLSKKLRWDLVLEEIEKCDLVCVCCHRLRTHKQRLALKESLPPPNTRYSSKMVKLLTKYMWKNKAFITSLKESNPCLDCGGYFQAVQMDFDHKLGTKVAAISQLRSASEKILLEEIAKCEIVCANCHRVRTYNRKPPLEIMPSRINFKYPEEIRSSAIEFGKVHGFNAAEKIYNIRSQTISRWAKGEQNAIV